MIYWKQRATIRWVKFGEANYKFFQAKATLKYRVNHISNLCKEDGTSYSDPHNKASILWHAFKQRLNTTLPTFYNLCINEIIINNSNILQDLEAPFTKEKIDRTVKDLPNDKVPG